MFRVPSPTTWNSESQTTKLYCLFFREKLFRCRKAEIEVFPNEKSQLHKIPPFPSLHFPSPFSIAVLPISFSLSPSIFLLSLYFFPFRLALSFPLSLFSSSHFSSLPKNPARGLGKRCWLSQPGPERSPGRRMHFKLGYRCW